MAADKDSRLEEALRRIEEARQSGAAALNLSGLVDRLADVLDGLAQLPALRRLVLSQCVGLEHVEGIGRLSQLEKLDLWGCEQVQDLQPLAGLASLQYLDLSRCQQIQDLQPLASLASLQSLNLCWCKRIQDLKPLAGLASLRSLDLWGCKQIRDLKPLAGLASLQSLDLAGCPQIQHLQPLAGLASLQSLNLGGCDQIQDLQPLAGLASLQSLNLCWCKRIQHLQPLVGLTSLQSLNIAGCEQIHNLEPLAGLASLQSLNLSERMQIQDLQPILSMRALRELHLRGCQTGGVLAVLRPVFGQLESLYLHQSHWSDFDDSLCGGYLDNVLEAVCAHFRDLDQEASEDVEVRVLVLGNGGAGKTQLTRRLRGLGFDPQVASTHGIELHEIQLENFALNLWDFGGQEIYHGAHSLFVQGRAVFLVLWTPHLETVGAYQENGLTMRHRPLHYWLDYLRAYAGTDYPVIVVQSQCDAPEDRVHSLPLEGFSSIQPTQVSAKNGLGLGALQGMLQDAVRVALQRRPGVKTGAGRIRLRQRIREMRSQHRLLARADFDALCDQVGGISSKDAALDYLHHCGVVFYRKELFRGEIVLDQNWALEAIYALFDRKKILPLLRGYGRFRREELEALIWQKYSEAEQKVFLGMMVSCGICFAVGDGEYIAPELLPERSEAQEKLLAGRISVATPEAEQVFAYGFLHEGLLRNFLSKIGEQAKDAAVYWKYGCWFYERNTASSVLVESEWEEPAKQFGAGKIRFRAWGGQADELVAALQQELERMPLGQKAELQPRRPIDEDTLALKDLSAEVVVQRDGGQKKVYVSYAWGKEESEQQKVVDGLCQSLQREGWQVLRDTEQLNYGNSLSDYMKMLAQGDRIIVVLSEKYLKSIACMTELYGIYQRTSGEKQEFLKHVVPLRLDDAKISSDKDQLAVVDYWQSEVTSLQPRLDGLSVDGFRRYKLMKSLVNSVSDMLSAISDTWHPKGFKTIVEKDFEGLKRMLRGQ